TPRASSALSPPPLHDALPIFVDPAKHDRRRHVLHTLAPDACNVFGESQPPQALHGGMHDVDRVARPEDLRDAILDAGALEHGSQDRKSTRLNSSHGSISYAVF